MREQRTFKEEIIDKALLLILMDLSAQAQDTNVVGDHLKCMKLSFLATYPMFEQKAKGFNLTFFRYEYGAFSKDIYGCWNDLKILGLLTEKDKYFSITKEGHALATSIFKEVISLPHNQIFKDIIHSVAIKYSRLARPKIMEIAYDTEVILIGTDIRMKVRDISEGIDLTMALEENEAESLLNINEAWLETLSLELNPDNKKSLLKAFEDYKTGRILSHKQIWQHV